jgi:hypothetical protein
MYYYPLMYPSYSLIYQRFFRRFIVRVIFLKFGGVGRAHGPPGRARSALESSPTSRSQLAQLQAVQENDASPVGQQNDASAPTGPHGLDADTRTNRPSPRAIYLHFILVG